MNKKIAFLSLAFAVAVPAFASAEDSTATTSNTAATTETNRQLRVQNQATREQLKTEASQLKDQKQQNVQDRCKNIQTRIDTQLNRYENNKQMFTTVFGNMQARLERLSQRLATKGVNVDKLNADIAELKTKIATLNTDHDAFIAGLKEVQANAADACGTSKGAFTGKLLGARKVSLTVQQDRLAIRNFFQNTIRPDIMAIRKQLEAQKTTTDSKTSQDGLNTPNPALQDSKAPTNVEIVQ